MLGHMTDEELELFHKQSQIIFILKRKNNYRSDSDLQRIEESIFNLPDYEIEALFDKYEDLITKETWVDCHPMFFHISEFEEALRGQLEFIRKAIQDEKVKKNTRVEWVQKVDKAIKELYERVNKSDLNELTLEEKEELFWITHPIIY